MRDLDVIFSMRELWWTAGWSAVSLFWAVDCFVDSAFASVILQPAAVHHCCVEMLFCAWSCAWQLWPVQEYVGSAKLLLQPPVESVIAKCTQQHSDASARGQILKMPKVLKSSKLAMLSHATPPNHPIPQLA